MTRLTDVERAERRVSGDALQQQIADLAVVLGWDWLHVGALRTKYGWRTPTRGTLAAWPDLTLVRRRDRRLIFAEVKRELEQLRPDQARVLGILRSIELGDEPLREVAGRAGFSPTALPRVEVHVWRPSDLRDPIESSRIYEVLR